MSKEVLCIPESKLAEVITVIREGLIKVPYMPNVSDETNEMLTKWCDDEEAYLKRLQEEAA